MHLKPYTLLRLFLICFLGSWSLFFTFSSVALAAPLAETNPITVASQTHVLNFPDNVDLQIQANDSVSPITKATVYIGYDNYSFKPYDVPIDTPASTISLTYREELNKNEYAIPGTKVNYQWVLKDKAGNQITTKSQEFVIIDTRFIWQKRSQGLIEVNWHSNSAAFGDKLLTESTKSLQRITAELDAQQWVTEPIHIWIYQKPDDFQSGLRAYAPDWAAGLAFANTGHTFMIIGSENDSEFERSLPHELTHMILGQIADRAYIPAWFNEGLAVYNQGHIEPELKYTVKKALDENALLRLYKLEGQIAETDGDVQLAYAQSWHLIDYMYTTFGKEKMQLLMRNLADQNTSFDEDLIAAFGLDTLQLENQWRLSHNQSPTLEPGPTPQTTPQPTPVTTTITANDNTSLLLIIVGSLMVLLSIGGVGAVFLQQRRSYHKAEVDQVAQPSLATISSSAPSTTASGQPEKPDSPTPLAPSDQPAPSDTPDIKQREYTDATPQKQSLQE